MAGEKQRASLMATAAGKLRMGAGSSTPKSYKAVSGPRAGFPQIPHKGTVMALN